MSAIPPPSTTTITPFRPWPEFFSISSLSVPVSLSDATARLSGNLALFRSNYLAVSLFILLLSLVYHPISLIVLVVALLAWFFLYFSRDVPLRVLDYEIDERLVVVGLGVLTVVALVFARVWVEVVVAAAVSGVVVGLHGVSRVPSLGDEAYGGLLGPGMEEFESGYSEF
ncbi:hypothetical protein Droror1_Dr00000866 [Drosera rotundifolia]